MTITTIAVADISNPTEVQDWLDANPTITISYVEVDGHMFYLFHV